MPEGDFSHLSNHDFALHIYDKGLKNASPEEHAEAKRRRGANGFVLIRALAEIHEERIKVAVKEVLEKTAGAKAFQMRSAKQPENYIIFSRVNMSPTEWRVTRLDDRGPSGHVTFPSCELAVRSYCGEWLKQVPGPPWASLGEYVFESAIGQTSPAAQRPIADVGAEIDSLEKSLTTPVRRGAERTLQVSLDA